MRINHTQCPRSASPCLVRSAPVLVRNPWIFHARAIAFLHTREPPINPRVQTFWNAFQARAGQDLSSRFYEAFHFADDEALADGLGALVLAGTKRATSDLLWTLEAEGKPLMRPGSLSIVQTWRGVPLCVIETTSVVVLPFEAVGATFAREEGEGDLSLDHWRAVHWAYFGGACQKLGRDPDLFMPVVCERFRVVHPELDGP